MKKMRSTMKLSDNSSFVILIFAILKFWNKRHFVVPNFDPHPRRRSNIRWTFQYTSGFSTKKNWNITRPNPKNPHTPILNKSQIIGELDVRNKITLENLKVEDAPLLKNFLAFCWTYYISSLLLWFPLWRYSTYHVLCKYHEN